MLKTALPLCLCAAALALTGCGGGDANNTSSAQPAEAQQAAGDQTIAASLDQNSRFFQAARAVGLDATLAGPGPYTVLVPTDQAFAAAQSAALKDVAKPENRAEVTRILTYHILPGVILTQDIDSAIKNGDGKAVLATMGGETLTATKEGDRIVLSDSAGGKATIAHGDQKQSNGVVQHVDRVLSPPAGGGTQGQGE